MKTPVLRRHGSLLIRSYFLLVAALLLVAVVLDLGFRWLQSPAGERDDPWLAATLALIESELAAAPPGERAAVLARLERDTGLDVRLLAHGDVASTVGQSAGVERLVDADGGVSYLYPAPAVGGLIHVGGLGGDGGGWLPRLLTPLFYLSIFVVVGLWLRPLLRDIDHITDAAQRFAADYREPLATAGETTRLTGLARNLDDMSARLGELIQSQKELLAALSHEMRTPLARIRFALAVIDSRGDDTLREQLDAVAADVREIDLLIGTMLSYARLDHPDLRMNWQTVPLEGWLAEVGEKWRQVGREVTIERRDSIETLRMDPHLMALALSNLLGNAVRYAAGRIRCEIGRDADGRSSIVVEDDGPGIPEAERHEVFKAFKRLDDSRNRDTGGSGLGLAIVARIAALHGGSVAVADSEMLGGARFTIAWRED